MLHRIKRGIALLSVAACLLLAGTTVFAQDQPAPKWEIFAGYSWADPNAKISGVPLRNYPVGVGLAGTYDFNKWLGLTLDYGGHFNNGTSGTRIPSTLNTVMAGPKLTFRGEHFSPFLEALVGYSRLAPDHFTADNRFGFEGGVGIDMNLTKHWALRLIQADFITAHHRFGAGGLPGSGVPKTILRATRLQGGVVWLVGGEEEKPVSASCSVDTSEVWAGEPVKATVTPQNFNPNHTLNVDWTTNGGKVEGTGQSVTINTTGAAEGQSYNVSAHVTDPHDKKAVASCQTSFSTKKRLPPTITCNASPSSVVQGGSITIHSDASSPQGGPVTVAVTSGCGASGQGTDVAVDTSNIQPGSCSATCTATDDHQLTANSTTSFSVQPKPVVQPPPTLVLRSVYFATAQPTEKNPTGGLVKSQQATLTGIASEFKKYLDVKSDAKLELEAHADPRGSVDYNQALTERRAARVKSFLVDQGVPGDSIDTRALGKQEQLSADNVKQSMEDDPSLTAGEKRRLQQNMRTIVLAANRRVDMKVEAPGVPSQLSERRYPFSAADALSLIGGREKPKVAPRTGPKKGPAKKGTKGGTRRKKK
ncbi:MAG TPA: OmpA family protein [Terriglobales bacterium]|nr:OmpA family protein [Terriglobales bacterium]